MTSSNWKFEYILARTTSGGEAFGVVIVLRPMDSSALSLTLINHKNELIDLNFTISNLAEYETLIEFGTAELDIIKESLSDSGSYYQVLVKKRERSKS